MKKKNPKCPKCKSATSKAGMQVYATLPHKRQKYICKECGHTFVPGSGKKARKPRKKKEESNPQKEVKEE